jgi:hypothetical protein
MSFSLDKKIDYKRHNEEVRSVWQSFHDGHPYRVPLHVGGSITNYFLNPELNTKGFMFKQFFEDPDFHIKAQLDYQKWCRFNILCDLPMGIPDDFWQVSVDFQNSFEAAWIGCPLIYWDWRVPDTVEYLKNEPGLLYDLPDPLDYRHGIMARVIEFYDYMRDRCKNLEYMGRPVKVYEQIKGERTDGVFTLATKIRGTEELLVDMMTQEKFYHDLMSYLTRSIISRIRRLKEYRWSKYPDSSDIGCYQEKNLVYADDSVLLLSCEQYKDYVYPYHRMIFDACSDGSPALMHLCGDATRHFAFMKDHLNIGAFDTGFPVDHGRLRRELGPDVIIYGGPTVMLVKDGTDEGIENEVIHICRSGIMQGGKFILTIANNMAPGTPVENVAWLYACAQKHGRYDSSIKK